MITVLAPDELGMWAKKSLPVLAVLIVCRIVISVPIDNVISELSKLAEDGHYVTIGVVIFVFMVLPIVWAISVRFFVLRKIENLYKDRLKDRDEEIKRLATTVKKYENKLLKHVRP